jgi:hypothetical protein
MQSAATPSEDGRLLPIAQSDNADLIHAALVNLLIVQTAFDQQRDLIKLSEPVKEHELATQGQQISTDVVPFSSKDFAAHVPAPTTQQLQEQFNKFADVAGGAPSDSNPLGFGYRYPNRVKLQYIAVPREAVRKVVKAQKSDYDWDVDAQRYYIEHPDQFKATTEPTTQASTTKPTTKSVASTEPTTKPFAEVHEEALAAVIDPKVEELQKDIVNKIRTRLATDWMAFHGAGDATTQPVTAAAPLTPYGEPFNSYPYLQKLAADIQKQTGVLPTVANIADTFKTQKELVALPGIGSATQQYLPFSYYATMYAQPFLPEAQKNEPNALALWQPSQVLRDDRETDYIFRLIAVDPEHKPASLKEVQAQVESDWRKAKAYELAKAQANQVLESAKKTNLSNAATGAGKQVTTTGLFSTRSTEALSSLNLEGPAANQFVEKAYGLLESASSKNPHPLGLIELPASGFAMVAQLQDVKPDWRTDDAKAYLEEMVTQETLRDMTQSIYNHWFDYDNLVARMNFKDENTHKNDTGNAKTASVE